MIKQQLDQIMQKEVTRGEFLGMVGFAVASLFGFSTLVRLLTGKSSHQAHHQNSYGFGSGAYGGNKEG